MPEYFILAINHISIQEQHPPLIIFPSNYKVKSQRNHQGNLLSNLFSPMKYLDSDGAWVELIQKVLEEGNFRNDFGDDHIPLDIGRQLGTNQIHLKQACYICTYSLDCMNLITNRVYNRSHLWKLTVSCLPN